MKKKVLFFLNFVWILLIAILAGLVCMILAYMLPLSEHNANVQESLRILSDEGWYPTMPYMKAFTHNYGEHPYSPAILDNYTDELMITISVQDPKGDCLQAAMVGHCARYWCGFVTVLRPILFLLDYGEIRMLNILVQILLVLILALLLYRRKGKIWCFWVFSLYALLTPYCMGMSMQNSCVFYIGMTGAIFLTQRENFFRERHRYFYIFFILGIITAYFDFLTYPLFAWAMPLLVWLAVGNCKGIAKYLKDVVFTGVCWILGYAGMWAGKWPIAMVVLKKDMAEILLDRIELHSIYGGTDISFLSNLERNLEKWVNVQTTCILLAWCLWFLVMFIKGKRRVATVKCIPFTIIACGSFAWLFVMRYHTFVHAFFTHRTYCTAFGAILAACICMLEEATEEKTISWKVRLPVVIAVGVCAFGIMLQCKVVFYVHNGDQPPRHIALEEGRFISETITKRYDDLKGMEIGLMADGEEGEFLVEIYDRLELLYQEEIPFSEVLGGTMYSLKLEKTAFPKEVTLCITTKNCGDENGYVYVTDGVFPLPECPEALLDGNALGGQITHSFAYQVLPGIKICLNFFLLIVGVPAILAADGYWIVCAVVSKYRKRKQKAGSRS